MHLMDGVVSVPAVIGGFVLAGGICAWSAYKTREEEIPKIAVFTAAFFVSALIHFKVGPTSVHLIFNGLLGVVLGRRAFMAMVIGLFLQAPLLQISGYSVLGVNACIFGIPAIVVWLLYRFMNPASHQGRFFSGALCGALGVLLSGTLFMLVLLYHGDSFKSLAEFVFLFHLPIMIIEGIVTGFTVQFLAQVQPALLKES